MAVAATKEIEKSKIPTSAGTQIRIFIIASEFQQYTLTCLVKIESSQDEFGGKQLEMRMKE